MKQKQYIAFIAVILLLSACSPTKRLQDHEYLLDKNHLESNGIALSNEELQEIVKQQPNRRILPYFRFHLHMYNLPSDKRLTISRDKKNARRAKKNERRAAKGKDPRGYGRTKWEYFKEVVGEPPVLLDTSAVKSTSTQISTYLIKKGYFGNHVQDSIVLNEKKQLAEVYYTLHWEEPYVLDTLIKDIADPDVAQLLALEYPFEKIKVGERFDVDDLASEREGISEYLQNRGYYGFTHNAIEFEVDSSRVGRNVGVRLILKSPENKAEDTLGLARHPVYEIGEIYFNYDLPVDLTSDTLELKGYHFVDPDNYPLNSRVLSQNTFLNSGMRYQQEKVEQTYRRLASLPALSHVSIRFEEKDDKNLDVFVNMTPARRQSFSLETQGTNSEGFLGIEGDVVYRHRNILRGAETLELRFKGGVQSQALITDNNASGDIQSTDNVTFNTIEFGPSISLRIPKFLLPISSDKFAKSANPATLLTASYSYQNRPDFKRELTSLTFGYQWAESKKKTHRVNLLEASVIRIDKSVAFQERLDELNDRFLSDSYRNHFITASTYTFVYNGQNDVRSRNLHYFRGNAELGGNLLRAAYGILGQDTDSLGSYEILGIRFANYSKAHADWRFYRRFDDKRMLATRLAGGIGVPYGNLEVLPFSKSFFGGGANGLRAWNARTIGPGAYFEPIVSYDKIGDIILEGNIEYRFKLIDYLDGAFFIDAGNIWLLNKDEVRTGAAFSADRFISEIGIGGGAGLRIDFSFFVFRFDVAAKLKDPSLVSGERWIFQPKDQHDAAVELYNSGLGEGESRASSYGFRPVLNLGIGYPF